MRPRRIGWGQGRERERPDEGQPNDRETGPPSTNPRTHATAVRHCEHRNAHVEAGNWCDGSGRENAKDGGRRATERFRSKALPPPTSKRMDPRHGLGRPNVDRQAWSCRNAVLQGT
eukprot:scaffold2235_cov288-Pavlova_lutheri.AAC.6